MDLKAISGNEPAWKNLTSAQIKEEVGYMQAVAYWTADPAVDPAAGGAPKPRLEDQQDPKDGMMRSVIYFGDYFYGYSGDAVCDPKFVLAELRRAKVAKGDPAAITNLWQVSTGEPYVSKLPPPNPPKNAAVGPEMQDNPGWYSIADLSRAPVIGEKVKGPDGRDYIAVRDNRSIGLSLHYEPVAEPLEMSGNAAPINARVPDGVYISPQAPLIDQSGPVKRTLSDLLSELSGMVSQEVFGRVLVAIASGHSEPVQVQPSIKILDANGQPAQPGAFIDHKVARKMTVVITAPIGSAIAQIPTHADRYTDAATPTVANPVGFNRVDDHGNVQLNPFFSFPGPGQITKDGFRFFFGPPDGTKWQPLQDQPFEVNVFNFDQPQNNPAPGAPRT